jgi:hypothetical protein
MGADGSLDDIRVSYDEVAAWLDAAGLIVEAQLLLGSADTRSGALLFARRPS